MTLETEPQNMQIKAKAYFAKDPATRTRKDRKELLEVLGVEHPGHFLSSVWSPSWEEAVDRVLDPRSSSLRPLPPTDFHFKWAVGALNLLPLRTRLNMLGLKLKPAGLESAIRGLLAKSGYPERDFVIEDLEVLRSIHAEYSINLRTTGAQRVRVEVSHYLPAAEEIFHRFAEPLEVPVTQLYFGVTPQGDKFVLELEESEQVELTEASHERLAANADNIIRRAGLHDAIGDVLGTIMRDPHYLLSAYGELYSFHHYQLFLEMDEDQFGFFRPIFTLLGDALGNEAKWFSLYRSAYIDEFNKIKNRAMEILRILDDSQDIVEEYVGSPGDFALVKAGVERRLEINPEKRADVIGQLFLVRS